MQFSSKIFEIIHVHAPLFVEDLNYFAIGNHNGLKTHVIRYARADQLNITIALNSRSRAIFRWRALNPDFVLS